MIQFDGLGHINIVVDDCEKATRFYQSLFNAQLMQSFPNIKNRGFAQSAGFLDHPEAVEASIRFLQIPDTNLFLELMQYHAPKGDQEIIFKKTNDLGGPRHICLRVKNIDASFDHVKNHPGCWLINREPAYQPFTIDPIDPTQFEAWENNVPCGIAEKEAIAAMLKTIRYFYFIDQYGVQWELEQGHSDIG
jgi:maltose O-acetyltransferase